MDEWTWRDDLRCTARKVWGKLRWRLALLSDLAAFLVLVGAIVGGIYAAITTAQAWPGAWVAVAAFIVLVAWGRANASSYRYQRYWWRAQDERHALLTQQTERIIEEE